ncbi:hypothetical protein CLV51_101644 [Chitinophaga niastensis]|uniref:Uncharacterized protein n=2 Tax=Chitinophaga niastensis TaxID=536980 RepID=A0A2P8HSX5_CHINA|nr:hypothetical protein CLV51_101644 [Chitinophaga niastensis]
MMAIPVIAQNRNQADLITNARTLKKGLYKSFEEFQTNSPSEEGDLIIKNRSAAAQIYLLASRNELVIRDAGGQEHKIKNYWGFCDGQYIYIKDNGLNKIQELGYYCMYELHVMQPSRGIVNQADMTVNSINTPVQLKKVVNIVTGQILELSAYNLKKYILPQDSSLLDEFRVDKEKKDQLEYYIYRFNQRNKPTLK